MHKVNKKKTFSFRIILLFFRVRTTAIATRGWEQNDYKANFNSFHEYVRIFANFSILYVVQCTQFYELFVYLFLIPMGNNNNIVAIAVTPFSVFVAPIYTHLICLIWANEDNNHSKMYVIQSIYAAQYRIWYSP